MNEIFHASVLLPGQGSFFWTAFHSVHLFDTMKKKSYLSKKNIAVILVVSQEEEDYGSTSKKNRKHHDGDDDVQKAGRKSLKTVIACAEQFAPHQIFVVDHGTQNVCASLLQEWLEDIDLHCIEYRYSLEKCTAVVQAAVDAGKTYTHILVVDTTAAMASSLDDNFPSKINLNIRLDEQETAPCMALTACRVRKNNPCFHQSPLQYKNKSNAGSKQNVMLTDYVWQCIDASSFQRSSSLWRNELAPGAACPQSFVHLWNRDAFLERFHHERDLTSPYPMVLSDNQIQDINNIHDEWMYPKPPPPPPILFIP